MLSNQWRKSSLSSSGDNCVEVRHAHGGVQVRNSNDPNGALVQFTDDEWAAFTGGAKLGEFDNT
jgi:hypothetical protein